MQMCVNVCMYIVRIYAHVSYTHGTYAWHTRRFDTRGVIQGKWKALKGGLTWYTGSITKLNNDETVDIMYDDNDAEHNVPLRFIQLLDKQPNTPSNSSNSKKRKGPGGAVAAACAKRRLPPAFIGNGTVSEEGGQTQGAGGDAEMQHASGLDAFLGLEDENMQDGKGSSGKKNTKGKARNKAKAARARGGGTARQSKTRLVVQELPDALPEKPLEECLLILNAVLGTKVAAPLMTADTSVLFPLLVKSSIEVLGKNAEKIPMDFVSIKKHLTKTCQARTAAANAASAGGGGSAHTQSTAAAKAVGHYRSAQQVREDVVRIIRLVNESLTVRQAMRVTCTKVFEAFNDLFEARVSPPLHQAGGMLPFQHGLHWLGQRVRVFWKDDFVWYTGCIDDHYGSDRYHIIYDDDGMEEWITLPSVYINTDHIRNSICQLHQRIPFLTTKFQIHINFFSHFFSFPDLFVCVVCVCSWTST